MKIIRYADSRGQVGYAAKNGSSGPLKIQGDIYGAFQVTSAKADVDRLLAPVVPSSIWGIGLNYRRHAEESGMAVPTAPVVFAKGLNSIQDPGEPILIPNCCSREEVDYECELVVVIGRTCKSVRQEDALQYVLGYTCGNDVSARDWQFKRGGSQWCRGKSFDTFAPIGPCLVTADDMPDPNRLRISTLLNGTPVQQWNTDDMIFSVAELIAFLSQSTTLSPGTVIFTGTPHGIGMAQKPPRWLREGDEVSIVIDGIGTLTNPVRNESYALDTAGRAV
jgi:2-keto-4-pentenoate hydratase/2-oxohepta-3-ene-1,7-dioic acid hydratase in catechol pathway